VPRPGSAACLSSAFGLILEIDIGQRLPVLVRKHRSAMMLAKLSEPAEEIMRRFIVAILVAAAAIYSSAHDVVLAQTATTPNVVPPFVGLSTPVTSTVTNCMMSCNSQQANCQTRCFIPNAPGPPPSLNPSLNPPGPPVIFNSDVSATCRMACTSTQLACQTSCARLSSIIGQ
jgi:hypothetical protein